jgi:hypothetical protein
MENFILYYETYKNEWNEEHKKKMNEIKKVELELNYFYMNDEMREDYIIDDLKNEIRFLTEENKNYMDKINFIKRFKKIVFINDQQKAYFLHNYDLNDETIKNYTSIRDYFLKCIFTNIKCLKI